MKNEDFAKLVEDFLHTRQLAEEANEELEKLKDSIKSNLKSRDNQEIVATKLGRVKVSLSSVSSDKVSPNALKVVVENAAIPQALLVQSVDKERAKNYLEKLPEMLEKKDSLVKELIKFTAYSMDEYLEMDDVEREALYTLITRKVKEKLFTTSISERLNVSIL